MRQRQKQPKVDDRRIDRDIGTEIARSRTIRDRIDAMLEEVQRVESMVSVKEPT